MSRQILSTSARRRRHPPSSDLKVPIARTWTVIHFIYCLIIIQNVLENNNGKLDMIITVLCKSNANVFCQNSRLFLVFRQNSIEFSISHNNSWSLLFTTMRIFKRQFVWNEMWLRIFEQKWLCSINDFEHMSKMSLFISSAQTFPSILRTTICQVWSCCDHSFVLSSHLGTDL